MSPEAFAVGDFRGAIRIAERTIPVHDNSQARRLIAEARPGQQDLEMARAALRQVSERDKPAVIRRCEALGVDLYSSSQGVPRGKPV